jgi:hypothetical protein
MDQLVGEWDGSMQVRRGDSMIASIASCSVVRDRDGALVLVLDASLPDAHIQASARIQGESHPARMRLFDSLTGVATDLTFTADGSTLVASSSTGSGSAKVDLRHVLRLDEQGRLILERHAKPAGSAERLDLRVMLGRLAAGEKSASHDTLRDARLLARVGASVQPGVAVAGAEAP